MIRFACVCYYTGQPSISEELIITPITPHECRLRDLTYAAPIIVDIEYTRDRSLVVRRNVMIGRLPIMLRSDKCVLHQKVPTQLAQMQECIYDPGGYFIVKGTEKVILIQEQLSKNRIIVEQDAKGNIGCSVTSSTHERRSKTNLITKNSKMYLQHNSLTEDIPIIIVMKALGISSDQELCVMIGIEHLSILMPSISETASLGIVTTLQALEYIGTRVKPARGNFGATISASNSNKSYGRSKPDIARDVLSTMIISHIPVVHYNFLQKSFYLALMIRRVLQTIADPSLLDDKDYYGNKRLELAGQLLSLLFEDLFKRFNMELKKQAEQVLSKANRAASFDILRSIRQDTITNGLVNAISTGNWNIKRFRMERVGVTQVLSRLSFISALGMMTRITSQFEKTRKVSGPRSLQGSQWGMLCPSDTPEGESCGLVKNLALMTQVTTDQPEDGIVRICYDLGVEEVNMSLGSQQATSTSLSKHSHMDLDQHHSYLVMLNGRIVGIHLTPINFVQHFRRLRRSTSGIPLYTSIYVNHSHRIVYISSDGGRVCRPLIILAHGRSLITDQHLQELQQGLKTFDHFVSDGLIEYLDVNEENDTMIALHVTEVDTVHTHLEIDPMSILGIVAGLIPFPMNNQSPRNTYQVS